MSYNNYNYDDEDLQDTDDYLTGYEEGRLEAGGGLPTLLGGIFIGAATVAIAWLMWTVWQ